jgi:hypothetical protein
MAKTIPIGKAFIDQKCGDCIHHFRLAKFEKPCKDLGVKHFAQAPQCFDPDPYQLVKDQSPDVIHRIALLLKDFNASQKRIMLSLMLKGKAFAKAGLDFGQPVYFRIGPDYLSNYYRGFAIDVATIGGTVTITSDLNKTQRSKPAIAMLLRENVYTTTDFKRKRARLEKQGKIMDPSPKFTKVTKTQIAKDDYVPPMMDSVPDEWFNKEEKAKKKKKKPKTLEFHV